MAPTSRFTPPGPLGFGGAPLGNMFGVVDEGTAEGALVAAWESGVRYFDTAPHYGSGLSEHRFGNVLRRYPREDFVLSTKIGRLLRADPLAPENPPFVSALKFRGEYDYSYDGAMRSIEDSYQRLGFPQIDIVYIHDIAEDHHGAEWEDLFATAMNGAAKALISLREQGVIKAWGLGVNLTEPCERALEQSDPDLFLLAGRYSLLNQPALERLFPACEQRGVHVVIGGPYNSGLLAGGRNFEYQEAPREMVEKRDRIAAVCAHHGVDLRAAALKFCAAHPVVAAIIPGAKHAVKVRENAELMKQRIPAALWDELRREGLLPDGAPIPSS
jgi:D-threo-aldose 1-dehydrogenase